ncbi:Kinesin-like protein KIF19 [Harpegnathos saltator]|uniref:Kinesin-like protein KIF19 n=1 Tax=Harpegnathos saltator TaxID=610380 RepID=E2B902_HARSA|nr:Kinesin-like protein KIF19 [Harpegnathos saltator]
MLYHVCTFQSFPNAINILSVRIEKDKDVAVRIRPLAPTESGTRSLHAVNDKEKVYEGTAKTLAQDVLNGYNATVFAYGATGSGKTHTMVGTSSNPGIMVRALNDIFLAAQKLPDNTEFTVSEWRRQSRFFLRIEKFLTNNALFLNPVEKFYCIEVLSFFDPVLHESLKSPLRDQTTAIRHSHPCKNN